MPFIGLSNAINTSTDTSSVLLCTPPRDTSKTSISCFWQHCAGTYVELLVRCKSFSEWSVRRVEVLTGQGGMAFLFIRFTELSLLDTIRKIPDFCFPSSCLPATTLDTPGQELSAATMVPRVSKPAAGCWRVVLPPVLCSDAVSGFKTNNKKVRGLLVCRWEAKGGQL